MKEPSYELNRCDQDLFDRWFKIYRFVALELDHGEENDPPQREIEPACAIVAAILTLALEVREK